ncbi:GNAT family N-acetyltransferase [Salmonella enterica]|uniref:GNAT family N-acetyltransferase n=4 Tax=Salmonella enterica TaxID=28901 RepID=A0A5U8JEX5_SALET|nr:GNAT family N-acetyltransferase [Salmonella enterica]EBR8436677.1 GNAT family N-acetyltransferase [Salmonella enterica subsp. enterica serovar Panama]EBU7355994.1 N-acetyltransferase [Salmonella enterica subsp. enterica serovar Poona]ASD85398.1 N-acetyltransferase [Salmonella enterica subsp. enterica serovar India str. SA20085604]EAS1838130.1 GNAT family N-acetyltransferase [Salmonella enterica]EAW2932048.1 GNAT family N-acetyltransferase [Salmonella enterica]
MLKIQMATYDDASLLSSMGYTSYRHHFAHLWKNPHELDTYPEQEYSLPAIARSLARTGTFWLIAFADAPVGFAKYSLRQSIEPEGHSGTLLHKIYLMPGETGKKFGEQLFAEVIRQAKAQDERRLWLEVLADNPGARLFYEHQGMTFVKEIAFTTATQTSVLYIMEKQL